MIETDTLIIGASISGLALAAALQKRSMDYTIIEKTSEIASPWRNHYERLHLHTNKRVSNLPYKKFDPHVPRYPSRNEVLNYLEAYQTYFRIDPLLNTEARSISKKGDHWITDTNNETFSSKYVIMATGAFGKPKPVFFEGMDSFPGTILHSSAYKNGNLFKGKKVLVVGFGNSACEIAIDLFEQGALPAMSVRSPVNIIPRDLAGIPILEISQLLSRLPPRFADTINAPLMRMLFGDISKLGLQKKSYGPFEEIKRDGKIPVLDIGTISHIRKGHIKIYKGIANIQGSRVYFSDGISEDFDAIIASIGFSRENTQIVDVNKDRFDDLQVCIDKQKSFGKDGLYFCGYWVGPTGQIHEIARDAKKIAKDIASKERQSTWSHA
jgi:indole-3-pyruvate monooxygenase